MGVFQVWFHTRAVVPNTIRLSYLTLTDAESHTLPSQKASDLMSCWQRGLRPHFFDGQGSGRMGETNRFP